MNTVKSGKYNNGRDNVQYARHGVAGQSHAGFWLFIASMLGAAAWAASVIF